MDGTKGTKYLQSRLSNGTSEDSCHNPNGEKEQNVC